MLIVRHQLMMQARFSSWAQSAARDDCVHASERTTTSACRQDFCLTMGREWLWSMKRTIRAGHTFIECFWRETHFYTSIFKYVCVRNDESWCEGMQLNTENSIFCLCRASQLTDEQPTGLSFTHRQVNTIYSELTHRILLGNSWFTCRHDFVSSVVEYQLLKQRWAEYTELKIGLGNCQQSFRMRVLGSAFVHLIHDQIFKYLSIQEVLVILACLYYETTLMYNNQIFILVHTCQLNIQISYYSIVIY